MIETAQHVIIRTGQELDRLINDPISSVVLIYASWCPFCIRFLPVFQKYAAGQDHFWLAQDDQEILADQYGVDIVPSVLCFRSGLVVARLDGLAGLGLNENQLAGFLRDCL